MTGKPRIRKIPNSIGLQRWACDGLGVRGVGHDPATSYTSWIAQRAWLAHMNSARELAKRVRYSHD